MRRPTVKEGGANIRNQIDVEIDELSRGIASANHVIDHVALPQDLTKVEPHHIDRLVEMYGRIDMVVATTPCQGLSRANEGA